MNKLHHHPTAIPFIFLFSILLLSACQTESQNTTDATSKTETDEASNTPTVDTITSNNSDEQTPETAPSMLKSKDFVYAWVDKLNVRDQPSLKGKTIASVNSDVTLEYTGNQSSNAETIVLRGVAYKDYWYQIITPDKIPGWVFGGAIKRPGQTKGNPPFTNLTFSFPHFGNYDLANWIKTDTKKENDEVDYEISAFKKGNQTLIITSSDMGEMHYGYEYQLKDKNGKVIKERRFSFTGDGKLLEETVKDYTNNTQYNRQQTLDKHWYQLNDKPIMANGNWTEVPLQQND